MQEKERGRAKVGARVRVRVGVGGRRNKAGGADHLVGGPEGDYLNVSILVGDGVAVPEPVKVMHHPTAPHTHVTMHHAIMPSPSCVMSLC